MKNHWSVSEIKPGVFAYRAWENPVSGSLLPADELEGKGFSEAVKFLRTQFADVRPNGSRNYPCIIVWEPAGVTA
jgi:hypothetical protein